VDRGRHEGEGGHAGPGGRKEPAEALVAERGLELIGRDGARVRVARVARDVGAFGPEREARRQRGAVKCDQSRPLSGILRPR
jgi:hypothetical protein